MIQHNNYRPSSPCGFDAASAFDVWMHRAVALWERRRMIRHSMKINNTKFLICVAVALASAILTTPCHAKVTFANVASNFLMDPTNAKFCVRNPAKIIGWGQRSIVKSYGNNQSSAWVEAYANNAIIGNTGLTGVTEAATTNLVDANSNAIVSLARGTLMRTTSNLLLYKARTYSGSLFVLNRRADSTARDVRTTSNAVNLIYQNMAVSTADAIDGTVFAKYVTNHYVFHNNGNAWSARGWVRFNNGFTIMPQASVLMDTLVTVSGGMDLRDTGTLILNNDLYLAHNVTLTNGGNIKGESSMSVGGQANTIFMGGDLTLASTTYARTLHITGDWSNSGTSGDLIIDGCGHTLNIGDRAQIFVDTNVTLTLRNMTIKTGPKSLMVPPIRLAAPGSKLALDNVMFDLGADFQFKQGQLFIHDEVAVTGTSAFIYQSPVPSYITSGATWGFEQGTTFSVAPATPSDAFYNGVAPYVSNNFIVLADSSSALSLSGCSFKTTFTGLRLTKGMVMFDNRVAVDTMAGVDLDATTPITQMGSSRSLPSGYQAVWSPDGRFICGSAVMAGNSSLDFSFDGASLTYLRTLSNGFCPSFTPDGRFVCCLGPSVVGIDIYSFTGISQPTRSSYTLWTATTFPGACMSPDGRFMAVLLTPTTTTITIQIWKLNGSARPILVGSTTDSISPATQFASARYDISWSPDGRFIAIPSGATTAYPYFYVYRVRNNAGPVRVASAQLSLGPSPCSTQWSPDGRFIAVTTQVTTTQSYYLYVYSFDGNSTLTQLGSPIALGSGAVANGAWTSAWSPNGRYLAVSPEHTQSIKFFRFDTTTGLSLIATAAVAIQMTWVAWSPDGRFLATASYQSDAVSVYRVNYVSTPVVQQGFSNGLVFGDKAKGANFDADVRVLGSATVKINGMVKDDSA